VASATTSVAANRYYAPVVAKLLLLLLLSCPGARRWWGWRAMAKQSGELLSLKSRIEQQGKREMCGRAR